MANAALDTKYEFVEIFCLLALGPQTKNHLTSCVLALRNSGDVPATDSEMERVNEWLSEQTTKHLLDIIQDADKWPHHTLQGEILAPLFDSSFKYQQ
jgi:hypothetical protein